MVEEIKKPVVCPMDVLEDEYERPLLRHPLEEAAPSGERLALLAVARDLRLRGDASQRPELCRDPRRLGCVRDEIRDGDLQLPFGFGRRIGLEHARLRLDHLAQRPVGDSFAVRKRAALPPIGEDAALLNGIQQLVDEPALSDSGNADERDELRRSFLFHSVERFAQQRAFSLAADERRANLT